MLVAIPALSTSMIAGDPAAVADPDTTPPAAAAVGLPVERLHYHFAPVREADAPPDPHPAPVLILPTFDVRDARLNLTGQDVLTPKGILVDAKARYLSPAYQKTLGPLSAAALIYFNPLALLGGWHPNDAEAMALYAQEERLRRIHESDDLIELYQIDDQETFREMKQLIYSTYRHEQVPQSISIPLN